MGRELSERQRLQLISQMWDRDTIDHLRRTGVGAGWRCLEAGAGTGSIVPWLAARVGETGRVVATDLDVQFLDEVRGPNVEVLRHDVTSDPAPGDPFDLIHCRLLLEHLPGRDDVLRRMVSWLAPGGWLVVEAALVVPEMTGDPLLTRMYRALYLEAIRERIGTDLTWARCLPRPLVQVGLVGVDAEGRTHPNRGGTVVAEVHRLNVDRLRGPLLATGSITEDEVDAVSRMYDDPDVSFFATIVVAAWGRRA